LHARYTQGFAELASVTSKALVNKRSNKVVNIASTKMMKKILGERDFSRAAFPSSIVMAGHSSLPAQTT
jgi:hypothetical protein